ncbi:YbaN family protein [Streptococcus cameli]
MKKLLLVIGGWISLGIGVAGIILPIIPTTPLLLLSGYCFAQSSEKFEVWLKQTKIYHFYVADYAETKSISKSRKKKIIWQIYLLMASSIYLAPIKAVKIALFCLTIFITYYLFMVIPNKEE